MEARTFAGPSLFSYDLTNPFELLRHLLVCRDDRVKSVGDLAFDSSPRARQAYRKIAIPHGLQAGENHAKVRRAREHRVPIILFVYLYLGAFASTVASTVAIEYSGRSLGVCTSNVPGGLDSVVSLHLDLLQLLRESPVL